MADHLVPGGAGVAVAAQQGGGVDFELASGVGGDIARRHGGGDMAGPAEQQPAAFKRTGGSGFGPKGFGDPACNSPIHTDIA